MSDQDDSLALLRDAGQFSHDELEPLVQRATAEGHNPAAMMYAFLDAAMRIARRDFPEHAESVYASATQMVFEAHFSAEPSSAGGSPESDSAPTR